MLQRVKRALLRRTRRRRGAATRSATWCSSRRPTARAPMPASCARSAADCAAVRLQPPAGRAAGDVRSAADRSAVMARREHRGSAAGRAARLLRRRRPRDRDRRARADEVRRADLRAPRDRPQHLRRQRPEGQGRDLHRGPGRGAARRDAGLQRPRRVAGGAPGGGGARLQRLRRDLPAGHQGARRGRQAAQAKATTSS